MRLSMAQGILQIRYMRTCVRACSKQPVAELVDADHVHVQRPLEGPALHELPSCLTMHAGVQLERRRLARCSKPTIAARRCTYPQPIRIPIAKGLGVKMICFGLSASSAC